MDNPYDSMNEMSVEEFRQKAEEILNKIQLNLQNGIHFVLYCDKETYENFYNVIMPETAFHKLFIIDPQKLN